MKKTPYYAFLLASSLLIFACTNSETTTDTTTTKTDDDEVVVVDVDSSLFVSTGLSEAITIVSCTMSDGSTADCYKIVTTSLATDHEMGPWCPTNISDDATAGGIWLNDGEVYDVDGEFVKNLATFYNDSKWMMYDTTTGEINVTDSYESCAAAAVVDVDPAYENYCVECLPSYLTSMTTTYYIPVTPVESDEPTEFGGGPNSTGPETRGLAFDCVVFEAPAPTSIILASYGIAPFDDYGGHINLAAGYHYHAATGLTTQIEQTDDHTAMIGYALDGYGMYGYDSTITDLDESLGHYDSTRGYHYHVDYAGNNNFINSLHGIYAIENL
jgi:hypothetical protein